MAKPPTKPKHKLLLPILLMVWPAAAIILALFAFAIISLVVGTTGGDITTTPPSTPQMVTNVVLFIFGALAFVLGLPSFIAGLVLLIVRLSK